MENKKNSTLNFSNMNMKKNLIWALCIIFIQGFYSCKTTKITRPEEKYITPEINLEPSVINIPFHFSIDDVQKTINSKLTGLLYEDNSFENNDNDNLMVKAWKKEDFTLKLENNTLNYRVPLKLWIKVRWGFEKLGIKLTDTKEIEAEIALKFKTSFYLNNDWTVTTFTSPDGYEWLSKPVLKVGPVDVPITTIANTILNKNKNLLSNEIDKAIKNNLNFRKNIQDIWTSIQKPVKINDEYNIWLKASPTEISSTPILSNNGNIKISLGIKSVIETFIGKKPDFIPNNGLPDYKMVKSLDNQFKINLFSEISYNSIDSLTKKYLKNETFSQDKRSVTIKDIKVYGSDNKMIIGTTLAGSFNGTIYLSGKPVYDSISSNLKFTEIDFDIETQNALHKTASWLLHRKFTKMIEDKMFFPVGSKIEETKKLINQKIQSYNLNKNLVLNGKINEIKIQDIFLTPESVKIAVIFKGNLKTSFVAD